eukprot:UC4_evm4s7
MQNLTFGEDGGLKYQCEVKHKDEPWLCFMSPHMQDVIRTPYFMFNSKFDAWQLGNIFQSPYKSKAEQQGVLQYGKDFLEQFTPVTKQAKNGAMITSCICHGCPWADLKVENKTSYQHYGAWLAGKTSGPASIHVDPSPTPNGGGSIKNLSCKPFPEP